MRIRIKPSFVVYILILLGFAGIHACTGLLTALIVHEFFHTAAAKLLKEPIAGVELAPFGGVMRYKSGYVPSKGIRGAVLALAGPAGNYAAIVTAASLSPVRESPLCRTIMIANLSMMLLNLIPALPFDGGSILFSLGYYLFDVSWLIKVLSFLGMMIGGGLCALAIVGLVKYSTLNLTLVIVGLYVLQYAKSCKEELSAQNVYAIIYERAAKDRLPTRAAVFRITGEERLCSLTACLCQADEAVFFVESEDGGIYWIGAQQLCRALLKEPYAQVKCIIEKQEKNEGKSEFSLETLA